MKTNKQAKNWWIDAVLMVGYLFCFYVEFTGVAGHEWLGVGLAALTLLHFWLHWDWVKAITKRFFKGANGKNRWYYAIDFLLVLGFVVILETGLVISTWVNLALDNYLVWLNLHIYSSIATLGLLVIKVGLHWRWVVNTTSKIFGSTRAPAPAAAPAVVPVRVPSDRRGVERREFLAMMGVVSVGSLLAISNVLSENLVTKRITSEALAAADDATAPASQTAVQTAAPTSAPTTAVQSASATQPEPTAGAVLPTPTRAAAAPTQQAVASCTYRCDGHCSFPGRCRRYTDQNNNGLCDLGECL